MLGVPVEFVQGEYPVGLPLVPGLERGDPAVHRLDGVAHVSHVVDGALQEGDLNVRCYQVVVAQKRVGAAQHALRVPHGRVLPFHLQKNRLHDLNVAGDGRPVGVAVEYNNCFNDRLTRGSTE